MAHFRGVLRGSRGEVSRLGHKNTGIRSELNTWKSKVVSTIDHLPGLGDTLTVAVIDLETGHTKYVITKEPV